MTTIEKVKSIQDIARKNGLSLNKKFTDSYLTSHSMFSGPQALADRIIGAMWDMCTHGINNGFDGSCKGAMDSLSDIVVKLTEIGDEQIGKLGKFSEKADAILKREFASRKDGIDVTEPLKECLASSMKAIDIMSELVADGNLKNVDAAQHRLLEESRAIITEIDKDIKELSDTTSTDAQEHSDAAIKYIKEWRNACSKNMLTTKSVDTLAAARDRVREWKGLVSVVGKKNRAKEQHMFRDDDDLSSIIESKGVLEMIDTFMRRMDSERDGIANDREKILSYSADTRKKIDEYTAEIESLEQQINDVKVQFQNGELDLPAANRKMKELKAKMDEPLIQRGILKDRLQSDNPYADMEVELEMREAIYNELLPIFNKLDRYKSDPVFLVDAVYDVDFYALVDMLNNSLDTNERTAIESIHTITMAFEEKLKAAELRRDQLVADRKRRQEKTGHRTSTREEILERERAAQNKINNDNEIDPDLLALMQQQQQQPHGQQQEQPVKRKIVPLSGDEV